MAVLFRYARYDEYPEIARFLNDYWAKDHIYVRSRPLFDWTFSRRGQWEEGTYSFAVAEDQVGQDIAVVHRGIGEQLHQRLLRRPCHAHPDLDVLAIGVLASALTRNQIIAWVSTAAVLLLLTVLIAWLTQSLPATPPVLEANAGFPSYIGYGIGWIIYGLLLICQALNLQAYLENFAKGIIDTKDVIYYLSVVALCLLLSIRALQAWKWR